MSKKNILYVKGAREHNLQNIDVKIPRDKFVVITGLSGSGKSSLAFDTIYAEGQRRYVESLSSYARQFLGLMEKPDVDYIEGLSPAVSIEQKTTHRNPRSTVGTVTEIYDYLRLLFSRIGHPHCYNCGRPVEKQTVQQIVDVILSLPPGTRIQVLAPVIRGRKGEYREVFNQFRKEGYVRIRVDGTIYSLDDEIKLAKNKKHDLDLIIDRLVVGEDIQKRLTDSVELALKQAAGLVVINNSDSNEDKLYSEHFACVHCDISYEDLAPRMFSFNSPYGACPTCDGLGSITKIDPKLLVMDESLSIREGALIPLGERQRHEGWNYELLKSIAVEMGFNLSTPWRDLTEDQREVILYGTGSKKVKLVYKRENAYVEWTSKYEGLINNLNRRYRQTKSGYIRDWIEGFMNNITCHDCAGARLRPEALAVTVNEKNLQQITSFSIREVHNFFKGIELSEREAIIAHQILKEVKERLGFLVNVGLDYLTLDRAAGSLSGGEAQRIRLATQIGSQLVGVLYILDEPSIGLHQRDNARLIDTLHRLRDLGNTVLVVEHDKETIERADFVVDLGPRAGRHGGKVIYAGVPQKISSVKESITGAYLSGRKCIPVPAKRRSGNGHTLVLEGASGNNLKKVTAEFHLGMFICVTGVSGSGKSTMVNETLFKALSRHFYKSKAIPLPYEKITGLEHLDKVIDIDQSAIGRTPRSNPATYT
ncbi:MAG: excinuclease ABC subunit A, partial [Calditrichales bacterium]